MKELLLLLSHYPFDESNRKALSKLIKEVQDWRKMAELINAHGIIALAAYNIKEAGLENEIPEDAMAIIENGYRQSIVRNAWLKVRWKEVNTILNNAGIKHIILKGMALEHTLYGSRGLRQMNDNDILIKPEEAVKAWRLLRNEGFTIKTPKSQLHIKIMIDISYHLPALYKDGYVLEIHTKLFDNQIIQEIGSCGFVENPVEIYLDRVKALTFPKEIHLKYLIEHFKRHASAGECQIRSYADICLLNNGISIDFPEHFILNPDQKLNLEFRKSAYKNKVLFIDLKFRWIYILGDVFPSIRWMKERYNCNAIKALLFYPLRFGKLLWLL